MVDLVDVFIQRAPMHGAVCPVMPGILEHEEDGDLIGYSPDGRKRHAGLETEVLRHRVEEPDLWEFNSEMAQ